MNNSRKEIIADSMQFVKQNKGLLIDINNPNAFSYPSPRISSEYTDCALPLTFDSYSHCSLGCTYCFAFQFKSSNTSFSRKLHAVNPKRMIKEMEGKAKSKFYKHFYKKRFIIHWGGLSDPFCNFEKANKVGYEIIEYLAKTAYPTLFSFKGNAIFQPKFRKLFGKYAHQKNFAFQVSIVTDSDKKSRQVEIGVQSTTKRIKAIKMLSDMGYYTVLRLRPFILGLTDIGLDNLLHRCLDAGIQGVSVEFTAIDFRNKDVLKKRLDWLGHLIGTKDIMKYFQCLSPTERGSYLRLNRLVKEEYIKKIYLFCKKNNLTFGCSDPDFKELSSTGCCCALPSKYPENKELTNWSKNQLTYHLIEARKSYHLIGNRKRLYFDKTYNPKEDTYLSDSKLTRESPAVFTMNAAERSFSNLHDILRQGWNNLRSPGNPRNYFHGKIMPTRIDEQGNLVFVYVASDYENRWTKEGIDLSN